jgi:hypothetical protein
VVYPDIKKRQVNMGIVSNGQRATGYKAHDDHHHQQ